MMGDRLKMIDTHIYDGDGSKRIERGKPRSRCQPSRDDICEDPVMPTPVIIVTGVSPAIAEELQSRGATIVGATRNVADVPTTASLLPVAADVTQEAGRKALLEAALARHGRLDGLVNNVGTAFRRASVDRAPEDFRHLLEVNLLAAFALCYTAHPQLKASRGRVVNVSSVRWRRCMR